MQFRCMSPLKGDMCLNCLYLLLVICGRVKQRVRHCWFSVSVACISVATRIDVFVFRPVRASFVLGLICILPLDLMNFARVDP